MKRRKEAMKELQNYLYNVLPDGNASVFIAKFIETEIRINEDREEYEVFIYDTNEFIVSSEIIPEEMIEADTEYFLNYSIEDISLEERTKALEDAVEEIAEVIFNG